MSDIIKSGFISFSEEKKTIQTIDKNDPKILASTGQSHIGNELESSMGQPLTDGESSLDSLHRDEENGELTLTEQMSQELEHMKEGAKEEGYNEGFAQGKDDGFKQGYDQGIEQYANELQEKLAVLEAENTTKLEGMKQELIVEYTTYMESIEEKMLETIEELVTKLVGEFSVGQGTIMHLVKCGLEELEIHGDLIIKLSAADLDYVIERKAQLTEEISEKITVEILKDQQLKKNEVVIETEMGTIESSLGVQMEGLLRELRLIKNSLKG